MDKKRKTVTVLISGSPYVSVRAMEALRMSVGLTLCDDDIRVVFLGDGVYLTKGGEARKDDAADKHLQTLVQLKKGLFAHDKSMRERGVSSSACPVKMVTTEDIAQMVAESDVLISWPS